MKKNFGRRGLQTSGRHTNDRYLNFSLGSEEFAIPLLAVREVIAMPEITPVPFSPPHFLGIMNLRGQIISIIDLRLKLNIKPKASSETAVIICHLSEVYLGVVVDAINQVIAPAPEELSEKPEMQTNKSSDYITRIYRSEDQQLIMLVDIAKALGVEDIVAASRHAA
jgi:purine-binding chemotaxis protein CheW